MKRAAKRSKPLFKRAPLSAHPLSRLIGAGAPRKYIILMATIVSFVEVAATLIFPILGRNLIDRLGKAEASASLLFESTAYELIAVLLVSAIAGVAARYVLAQEGLSVSARLRRNLFVHMLRLPVSYHDERGSGEKVSRLVGDTSNIAKLVTSDIQGLASGVLLLIGSAVVLSLLDIKLTIAIFSVVFAAFILTAPVIIAMTRTTVMINDATATFTAAINQTFSQIRLVKAFSAERIEEARAEASLQTALAGQLRAARLQAGLEPIMSLALTLAMMILLVYGGSRVANGSLSAGTLTAFILYVFNISAPLIQITTFLSRFGAARGAAVRLGEVLDTWSEIDEANHKPVVADPSLVQTKPNEGLRFASVRFAYPGVDRPALQIDDLHLPFGSSTAIIGRSGAGKTSVLSLIERFYSPDEGSLSWRGVNLRAQPLTEWRNAIGYVPQSAPMMSGTIRQNIEYGRRMGSDLTMEEAAAFANCTAFIDRLPSGYDTEIGENGVKLSGGERQRLAIARMFMRDPRVVLLDEVTSNLDPESESSVIEALRRLLINRTALMVTHRMPLIWVADNLLTLEAGKIVEFGPTTEMARSSIILRELENASFALPDESAQMPALGHSLVEDLGIR